MEAERQRNLSTQIGDIRSKGLQSAYDRAMEQRLGEATLGLTAQKYGEESQQFGAEYGLKSLADQMAAGREQRRIAQEPLDFGFKQFEESVAAPREAATFMSSLLQGLPVRANTYEPGTQGQSAISAGLQGGLGAYNLMDYFSRPRNQP
jgi:hypothetical protein